ncbi:hypothetical protein BVG19_g1969 [[Candida] boidinii]|nr:hypothetical protein BVG19_g1969 [[Candida] boidinii]OWB49429.1 hypothetical protein B5S27_g970 [[Candida] boidinii]
MTESQNWNDKSAYKLKIENEEKSNSNEIIKENHEEKYEENVEEDNVTEIEIGHDESNISTHKMINSEDAKPYHHILKFYKYINHYSKSESNMSISEQNSMVMEMKENNENSESEIENIVQDSTLSSTDKLQQRRKRYWGSNPFNYRSKRSKIKTNENEEKYETILEECSPNVKNEQLSSDSESETWSNSEDNRCNAEVENTKTKNEDADVFEFFSKPPVQFEESNEIYDHPEQGPFFSFKNILVSVNNILLSIIITLERTIGSVDSISRTSPNTWIRKKTGLLTFLFL